MSFLSVLTLVGVALWVALVVVAQLLAPEQSPLSMGMSGLARARRGWIMKLAFVVRGATALAMVAAAAAGVPGAARSEAGLVFFAVWGVGSALLAAFDTDMPGEALTRTGKLHAGIAMVAYVAAVVGMALISLELRHGEASDDVARWALPIALGAALAMLAQFAGFGAATGSTESGMGRYGGLLQRVFLGLVMLWTAVVAAGI